MVFPDTTNILMFVLAGLALNITPGPDMLYTATRTLAQGKRAGMASALGISSGCLVHVLAAALGLSAVLAYSATAYQVIKYAGASYLVYLGIKAFRSGDLLSVSNDLPNASLRTMFWQGALTNVLNPKVALFFLSFLPQFINPEKGHIAFQMSFLGGVFIFNGTLVLLALVLGVARLTELFRNRPASGRWLRWLTGSVFIGLGARLALAERR